MYPYSNTKVTMELRDVLATRDENGQPFNLWDFDYPSYYTGDEKTAFEQKVIDHFYFHQIGFETIARFKHYFKMRIREIMPYYIDIYKSVDIMKNIDDPFGNVDMTETFEQTTTGTSSGSMSNTENGSATSTESQSRTDTGTGTSTDTTSGSETTSRSDNKTIGENSEHRFSNTPQGSITNIDNYLTEAAKDSKNQTEGVTSEGTTSTENASESSSTSELKSSGTGETTSTSEHTSTGTNSSENSGTVKYTSHRKGNHGANTYAHDMIEFRQSIINVDMMVIDALRNLFLYVY